LKALEPAADQGSIIALYVHDSLQVPRLGSVMVRLPQPMVKRSAGTPPLTAEWAGCMWPAGVWLRYRAGGAMP
jgi:hypothetical protein